MTTKTFAFHELAGAPLVVDAIYEGGAAKNSSDDPLNGLLPVGNSGGIRFKGQRASPTAVALIVSGGEVDWPDHFDPENGTLTYFGDNRAGGRELHDTPRGGNVVLRNLFDGAQGSPLARSRVAPVFIFSKFGRGRSYTFAGLAVPGGAGSAADDLVGIWRTKDNVRFQNYRATFTVLDISTVSREWLTEMLQGNSDSELAPAAWKSWRAGGPPKPLLAPRTADHRTRKEQQPVNSKDVLLVQAVYDHFKDRPTDFEHLAAYLVRLFLPDVRVLDVTRKS